MGLDAITEFAASVTVADLEADPYPVFRYRPPSPGAAPARPPEFRGWEFRAPRRLDVLL
jgi:hypothetical protein